MINKMIEENKKIILPCLIIFLAVAIMFIGVIIKRKNTEGPKDKFSGSILAMIEKAKTIEIDNEYLLVNFPDKYNVLLNDGKFIKSDGKKYDDFKNGYILIYDKDTYAFKVSNGLYCATKSFDDDNIYMDLSSECEDYGIDYLVEE